MMRFVAAIAFCLGTPLAVAQVAVPPPPKPADSGPSLEVTMQYLQQKLSGVSKVSFVVPFHNITDGSDGSNTFIYEISNVVADVGSCRVSYHIKTTRDGDVINDMNAWVPLKQAKDVIVEPVEQTINRVNAEEGVPNMVAGATTPPVLALTVRRQGTPFINTFYFIDPDLADRVAKAFTHAIELCGGGNKDPF